jgi:hypothetical protein
MRESGRTNTGRLHLKSIRGDLEATFMLTHGMNNRYHKRSVWGSTFSGRARQMSFAHMHQFKNGTSAHCILVIYLHIDALVRPCLI